ncbi:MAG: hypothetical protein JST40_06850 [Armatimonadetes bacterium]|nr:hypothetical protein [Armatimonadota bacterium]
MNIPQWWLVVSGVFFVMSIVLLLALIIAVIYLIYTVKDVGTKVGALGDRADQIMEKVQGTTHVLTHNAESIGSHANQIVKSVAGRVDTVALLFIIFNVIKKLRGK